MLVLTRKLNETILIDGGEITIRVVDIRGGRVRLGIEAPQHVRIERQELETPPPARIRDDELVSI
jgi:carbon storage regulator